MLNLNSPMPGQAHDWDSAQSIETKEEVEIFDGI
jgi:hypothetical protein